MTRVQLSIVIPAYNEYATIKQIIDRVLAVDLDKEIIIVDDGSTDGTAAFLAELGGREASDLVATTISSGRRLLPAANVRVLFQETNQGKGAALRRGFREARGEIVIIQDADLEYDPQNYHSLIEPIVRGEADVVYGSRFLGGPHRVLLFWHYVGNKLLTTLSDMVTDLNLSDVWTCYKAFRREVLEELDLREKRFGIEQEITCKVARNGWRVYEVPISYHGRTYAEGKKVSWTDGLRGLWCILRYAPRGARRHARHPERFGPGANSECAVNPVLDCGPAVERRGSGASMPEIATTAE
jgi:glycosyltransferase involved in cell wall biosynthesis